MRQVILHSDLEDSGWIVEVPSLPGCISQGETKEEALENIRQAIEQWTEAAKAHGMAIPEETFDVQVCVLS